MKYINRLIRIILMMFVILFSNCGKRVSSSEFFPLVEGSKYVYRGTTTDGKVLIYTIIVKAFILPDDSKVFYFIDILDQGNSIIGSNMFGLGSYFFDNSRLWTIESFWTEELQKINISKKQLLLDSLLIPTSSSLITTESKSIKILLEKFEYVSVPAGNFKHCAKLKITTKYHSGKEYISYVWLARGVGLIKWQKGTGKVDELISYHLQKEYD